VRVAAQTGLRQLHRARRQLQAALNQACDFGRDERGVFVCEPKPEK
jgi:hypothetical protein